MLSLPYDNTAATLFSTKILKYPHETGLQMFKLHFEHQVIYDDTF